MGGWVGLEGLKGLEGCERCDGFKTKQKGERTMDTKLYKVELTMSQWGVVLDAIRNNMCQITTTDEDGEALGVAEDRIIDMRFKASQ